MKTKMITKCMKKENSICGGYDITLKKRVYCNKCKNKIKESESNGYNKAKNAMKELRRYSP